MHQKAQYDVAIIGGGLAGLSLAIQLARKELAVVLFEREQYPFHKVCGEYISMESWCFLQHLGVPLHDMNVPVIEKLCLTAPNGTAFQTQLPLGGFGISRYTLDLLLCQIAKDSGVTVLEETRVDDVKHTIGFEITYTTKGISAATTASVCCGTYGKRSNLDVKWKRDFVTHQSRRENNYLAVKYHIKTDWPDATIGLHNFKNGYCGISKIESNQFCFCYLTTAANLKEAGGSIPQLEQNIVGKNPALKAILDHAEVQPGFPVSIAQVSFAKKTQVEKGVLLVGDSGGMIAPLCGNGMSMALHGSKIAAQLIPLYIQGELSHAELEARYKKSWHRTFAPRLAAGRLLQHFFGGEQTSNFFVQTFRTLPFLARFVIEKTHGQPF
ncbi:MAG TPA: NAD(P)/FAD-dependent oxidoreductase [Chitinophagaceae bacterium]|nr:NAD(P)/FAD-dependent oxidoreductase [Chitinophagaceae bacterium]